MKKESENLKEKLNIPQIRFKRFDKKILITNDSGNYAFLTQNEFDKLINNKIKIGNELHTNLSSKGFVKNYMDFNDLWYRWQSLNSHLFHGPALHILVTTLRCNHKCIYCQSQAVNENNKDVDMSFDTAKKSIDFAFNSNTSSISIEFQGGEPLINFNVLKKSIEYARKKEKELNKKAYIALVTNFSLMDLDKAEFLLKNEVSLCTSLDGFEYLHDKLRIYTKGNSYKETVKWIKYFQKRNKYQKGNEYRIFKPSALLTVTKDSLKYPQKIVDEYLKLELDTIFIRPLSPIGFAKRAWNKIGYKADEFLLFYNKAFDYIIEQNIKGKIIKEKMAIMLLRKIIKNEEPGYVDLRCPCGAGVGQIAYNFNGDVYTCDEGRMVGWEGNETFKIGNINTLTYEKIANSTTTKLCMMASNLEEQPLCNNCVYRPYCGVCPVINLEAENNIWGNNIISERCKIFTGIFDMIFEKINTKKYYNIFERWLETDEKGSGQ